MTAGASLYDNIFLHIVSTCHTNSTLIKNPTSAKSRNLPAAKPISVFHPEPFAIKTSE